MPAYNAEQTIERTWSEIPRDVVDEVIVVDDHSSDATADVVRRLGLTLFVHERNLGYGGNQKTCYREALRTGADIVIMLHPDYQYPPRLLGPMAAMLTSGMFDIVLGSRILGGAARKGGMPVYKYFSNRMLTFGQNLALGATLSEYHTGYRAYTRAALERLPLLENSDDFVFDNQVLAQAVYFGLRIGEISTPASYHPEASSISFRRSVRYGLGVVGTSARFVLQRAGLLRSRIFDPHGRKLDA
jgi:glycosyltransferase involved in cell wall biosynthesis